MEQNKLDAQSKIAIITGMSYVDVDRILAAFTLGTLLANKSGASVDISIGYAIHADAFKHLVGSRENVHMVNDISLSSKALELNNILEEVGNIAWQNTNGSLSLQLFNLNGEKIDPENISLGFKSGKYDDVYLLGVRSEKYLLKLLTNTSAADLKQVKLKSLNVVNKEESGFDADEFTYTNLQSYSAAVFKFAQAQNLELSPELLNDLLAGIYWKTNALRNYFSTKELLACVAEMWEAGADVQAANQKIFVTSKEIMQSVWSLGSKIEKHHNIAIAAASEHHDYEKMINEQINPVLTPLFFTPAPVSFTLLPISNDKTFVIAASKDRKYNLNKLLREFEPKGDNLQVKFTLNMNVDATKAELMRLFDPNNNSSAKKPEPVAPAIVPETPIAQPAKEIEAVAITVEEEKPIAKNPVVAPEVKPEPISAETDDPLAPAKIDFSEILKDDEESADDSSSMFGFGGGGNSDPLPKAKN